MTMNRRRFLEVSTALGASALLPTLGCHDASTTLARDALDAPDTADTPDTTDAHDTGPEVSATDSAGATDDAETAEAAEPTEADSDSTGDISDGLPRYTWEGPPGWAATFECGVASGDPLSDRVLLWTRVSREEANDTPLDVFLEVASDPAFEHRVAAAWFDTSPARDDTLTVDQVGLAPGTTYYYRFSAVGRTSPTGRTRTAPSGPVARLRLGVVSCASYGWGYFHAYRHLANRLDLDAVVHVGDYIYEHASDGFGHTYGTNRVCWPPNEIVSLSDYRARYWIYRKDPDLQELHRLNPIIHMWDDHEFANDPKIGGASNHQPATEGAWSDRVAAALQAYGEWMPSRLRDEGRLFRTLDFGALARLALVDRQRRFLFPADGDAGYLGTEQGDWLDTQIAATSTPWFLLATGTRFASRAPDGVGQSSWDQASRRRVLDALALRGTVQLVALTGDTHRFDALDVVEDPVGAYDPATGAGSEGVELACGSVTSPGEASVTEGVPQFFWSEHLQRGYLVLELTPAHAAAEFWGFPDEAKAVPELPSESLLRAFTCELGQPHLVERPS